MKKFVPLFALLLASLALAACGSDSSSSGDTSPVGGAAEEVEEKAGEAKEEVEGKAGEAKDEAEGGTAGASTLDFEADPSGSLAYTTDEATGKAGKVTVNFTNQSPIPHDVALEDESGEMVAETEVLAEGSDSTTAELKPGKYTFYCTVPGHRQAGMEGTLTVK